MSRDTQKELKEFWRSLTDIRRKQIAWSAGTTENYLRQVLACGRRPSATLAKALEIASEGEITRRQLLPDIFGDMTAA